MSEARIHYTNQYEAIHAISKDLLGIMDFNYVKPCLQRAFDRGNECFLEFLDIGLCQLFGIGQSLIGDSARAIYSVRPPIDLPLPSVRKHLVISI